MLFNQYFCVIPNCKYHFKNGNEARFIGGVFRTAKPTEIEELNAEVAGGHELIYIKQGQETANALIDDPLVGLKAKIRADILAELEKNKAAEDLAVNSNRDFGNTGKQEVKAASSQDIKPVSASSNGVATASVVKAAVASVAIPTVKV